MCHDVPKAGGNNTHETNRKKKRQKQNPPTVTHGRCPPVGLSAPTSCDAAAPGKIWGGGRLPRAQNSTFIYSFIHHDLVQGLLVPRLSHPLCSPTSSIDALLPLYLRCFELLKAGAVISGPVQHRRDPPWGQQFAEHLH